MSDFRTRFRLFLGELKRRKVIRVGLVYLAIAWLTVQVVDATFEHLPLPGGSATLVLVLLVIGFPLALALAWAYEITPEGLKRDLSDPAQDKDAPLALLSSDPPDASIAILPFVDMSPDRDQEYFCDGVAEEILNMLTRIPDLHSGFQLWSARYDRSMEDIFSIQEEIGSNITEALEVRHAPCKCDYSLSIDAYDYYLPGQSERGEPGQQEGSGTGPEPRRDPHVPGLRTFLKWRVRRSRAGV